MFAYLDVADDLAPPTTFPALSWTGRDGSGDVDGPPVLVDPLGFAMLDRFALPGLGEDAVLFLPPVRRNDQAEVLADGFRGRIAEEGFGGGIPGCDDSVEGLAYDRIIRGRDDCC